MENIEKFFLKKDGAESNDKARYEKLLWKKNDVIFEEKKAIENEIGIIYEKIKDAKGKKLLSYPEKNALKENEDYYWDLDKKLRFLEGEENKIQEILEKIELGMMPAEDIKRELSMLEQKEIHGISKRKKRILEDREKTGFDSREAEWETRDRFGAEKNRITTGRNRKDWKGGASSFEASSIARDFYESTSGTHGGKTDTGKKGDRYVGKGGKIIRKV